MNDLVVALSSSGDRGDPRCIVLVVLLFLAVGVWQLVVNVRRLLTWPATTGTVIGVAHDLARNGRTMKATIVEFSTHDGRPVQSSDRIKTAWTPYRTGRQVAIRYDVRNPTRVVIGYRATVIWSFLILWMATATGLLLYFL